VPYIIRSVELRDFLSHEHTLLELDKGVTALVGENGAGKSSIVDAIYVALNPNRPRVRGSLANLVRASSKTGYATVTLTLEDPSTGEKLVSEVRIYRQGRPTEATLYLEDPRGARRRIASGVRSVEEKLAEKLGILASNYKEIISKTIVLRQDALSDLIAMIETSGARKREFLSKVFGTESYLQAAKKLDDLELEIEPLDSQYGPAAAKYRSRYRAGLERARRELEEKSREAGRLRQELVKLESRLEEARREQAELQAESSRLKEEHDKILSKMSSIRGKLEGLENEKLRLEREAKSYKSMQCDRVDDLLARAQQLLDRSRRLEEDLEKLRPLKETLEMRKKQLESELSETRKLVTALKGLLSLNLNGSLSEAERLAAGMEEEAKSLSTRIGILKKQYEALQNELDDAGRTAQELAQRYGLEPGDPEKVYEELAGLLDDVEKRLDKLTREISELKTRASMMEEEARLAGEKARLLESGEEGHCPLCGHELTPEQARTLAEKLRREAREKRENAEKLAREAEELEREKARLARLREELKNAANRLGAIVSRLREQYGGYREALETLEELRGELEEAVKRRESLEREYKILRKRVSNARHYYAILGMPEDAVPDPSLLEKLQARAAGLEEELSRVASEIRSTDESIREREEALREAWDAAARLFGIRTARGRLSEKLSETVNRLNSIVAECARLRDKAARLAEVEKEISEIKQELEAVEAEYSSVKSRFDQVQARLEELNRELNRLSSQHGTVAGRLKTVLEDAERFKAEVEAYKILYRASAVLDYIRSLYRAVSEELYKEKLALLEDMVSSILQGFNLKYVESRIVESDGDLLFELTSSEGSSVSVEQLSGGEKTAFALALVLALNKMLGGRIGFLVLDEPTAHLDRDRRTQIAEIIGSLRGEERGLVDQLLIVTHEREVIDVADEVYTVRYTAGRSTVTAGAEGEA